MTDQWGQTLNRDRHEVIRATLTDQSVYLCVERFCGTTFDTLTEVAQHVVKNQWKTTKP